MNKQLKAALMSALVYPGAGHFTLKKYVPCFAFAGVFSVPLYLVISEIMDKTNKIVEQITTGVIPLDIAAITAAVSNMTSGPEAQHLSFKINILIFVWFIAILDAYRVGKVKTEDNPTESA